MDNRLKTWASTHIWWTPLLIGACIAIGYGLTQRIMIAKGDSLINNDSPFQKSKLFPGIPLDDLKYTSIQSNPYTISITNNLNQDSSEIISSIINQQKDNHYDFSKKIEISLKRLNKISNEYKLNTINYPKELQSYYASNIEMLINAQNSIIDHDFSDLFMALPMP